MSVINKSLTKIASVFLLVSGLIFAYCYIVSGGSQSEDGPGAVWWYFVLIGLPSALAAVAIFFLGIFIELNKSKKVNISGKSYGVGSLVALVLLALFLGYSIIAGIR